VLPLTLLMLSVCVIGAITYGQPGTPAELGDEPMFSIYTAVERVTGQRPSPATCARWTRGHGVKGERLNSWMCGGRRLTTLSAVRDFIERTTNAANGVAPDSTLARTNRKRDAAISAAERELDELGA
jgi:hypothetical protein